MSKRTMDIQTEKQNNLLENKAFSQVLTHGLPITITSESPLPLFMLLDFL